jgi:hypothetical protein
MIAVGRILKRSALAPIWWDLLAPSRQQLSIRTFPQWAKRQPAAMSTNVAMGGGSESGYGGRNSRSAFLGDLHFPMAMRRQWCSYGRNAPAWEVAANIWRFKGTLRPGATMSIPTLGERHLCGTLDGRDLGCSPKCRKPSQKEFGRETRWPGFPRTETGGHRQGVVRYWIEGDARLSRKSSRDQPAT